MTDPRRPTAPFLLRASAGWTWRILVIAAGVYALFLFFGAVFFIAVAVVAALLLTALLIPLTQFLKRIRFPPALAALVTVLLLIAVLAAAFWFVSLQTVGQFDQLQAQLSQGLNQLSNYLEDTFGISQSSLNDLQGKLLSIGGSSGGGLVSGVLTGAQIILETLAAVVLAIFTLFFLLKDGPVIWAWIVRLFSPDIQDRVDEAGRRGWGTLTGYVHGTVLVALIDAVFIGVGIWIVGVPLVFPLALLTFFGAFIPIVGATVAGAAAVLVAFVTNGFTSALIVLGIVLLVQQVEGNILQPVIQRKMTDLHPLAILLAVAVGGVLAGIVGALVAVPITAVVATVIGYFGHLHREGNAAGAAVADPHEMTAES